MHAPMIRRLALRAMGESYADKDTQLEAAVRVLLQQIGATRRAASGK